MPTQFTVSVGLGYWQLNDRDWHLPYEATLKRLDGQAALGPLCVREAEIPSTSRNVRVAAGRFRKDDGTIGEFAGTASQAIPAGTTRRLWLDEAGTLALGADWPTGLHVPLASVTADAGSITQIVDERIAFGSVDGGS